MTARRPARLIARTLAVTLSAGGMLAEMAFAQGASGGGVGSDPQLQGAASDSILPADLDALPLLTLPSEDKSRLERLQVRGDMRLRAENDERDVDKNPDRHRERTRFRLTGSYEVNDELVAGARLTTGGTEDPNSPHENYNDGFSDFKLKLDQLYVRWKPEQVEGLTVTYGKFGQGFYRNPVYGELLWDADVNPTGLALQYKLGDNWTLHGSHFVADHQEPGSESTVDMAQIHGSFDLSATTKANVAVSYYYWGDPTPDGLTPASLDPTSTAKTNAGYDSGGDFLSDFATLNPILALTTEAAGKPLTFSGEYMLNTEARAGVDDDGFALGVAFGSKNAGDWKFYYQYQEIGQDVALAPFVQDDFLRATDFRGHVAGANYQFTKTVGLNIWTLISQAQDAPQPDEDEIRLRFDLNIKF